MSGRFKSALRLSFRLRNFLCESTRFSKSFVDELSVASENSYNISRPSSRECFPKRNFSHVGYGDGGRIGGLSVKGPPEDLPYTIKGLNHIAIAVPDLSAASEHYRNIFGAHVSEPLDQPAHGVTVVFVRIGNFSIELLHPLGEDSPIAGFLQKNPKGGLHHLCLTVDDLEAAVDHVKGHDVKVIGDRPKLGAHHHPVMFLNPKTNFGVLCELEEIRSQYTAEQTEDITEKIE